MISKCKLLKNIGKFYNFSAQANSVDWHRNTFIFAPNAYGKSTLVNVLRSLGENNPKLIRARKTLGAVAAPEAVIVVDGANHVFNVTRWDRPWPTIQIFDAPFIHSNILAHEIGHEHKKNIHKIIIGATGINLAEELTSLKTREKAKSQEVTNLVGQFNRGGITLSMDAFLAIAPTEETSVGGRIQKIEQKIKSKESEAVVQVLGFPRQIAPPSFDLTTAKTLAGKKLAAAHEAAEKKVLAHIDRNFKDKSQARQFIRQGLDQIQTDCPLCGQDLKNATDLLKAYGEFFDEAFCAYQQSVAGQIASLAKWNLDNDLTALASTHNANLVTVRHWEPYLGSLTLPNLAETVDKCRARCAALKDAVRAELEKKQADPNADADFSRFDAFADELTTLKAAVEHYDSEVIQSTEKAKKYLADLPKSDVAAIRAALAKEQEINKRFAPEWKKWATDYPIVKQEFEELKTQKNAKQKELEDYGRTIFDTYQKRINELLVRLGTDFTLTGLTGKTDERANESYSDFGFLILQQTVPLTARQDDAPCFKNTLSEGDKSTLAFAFFMAALEKMQGLDKQVIVLDDPLSSLDETRREATASLLLELSPKVNQLIVFTHKKDFVFMLCDKMPDNKALQFRSDKKNGSQIVVFDVEEERKSDHARLIEGMERYLVEDFGPTPDAMQGNLRKIFETVLKTKYYRALAAEIKAKHGLATLLTTLFNANLLDAGLKPRLFDICSVANGSHHGEIVDAIPKKLTRDELLPLIREALDLIHKV